jgi:DNA-binding IclR family transcriptional regulator
MTSNHIRAPGDDLGHDDETDAARGPSGSQTLLRGLDVIEAVVAGPLNLAELADRLGLTRSTTHRLAANLVERRYLSVRPREGYSLGPKLLELGFMVQQQRELVPAARPHLEALAALTENTVHLGVLDEDRALYLDKIAGRRRIEISSRIGDRQPVTSTGLGKALILDMGETRWRALYDLERERLGARQTPLEVWLLRMQDYARLGNAFDLEENEDRIRCVSAPIRDVTGQIVGAVSVSGAAQYMIDDRLAALAEDVKAATLAISRELGWSGQSRSEPRRTPRSRPAV